MRWIGHTSDTHRSEGRAEGSRMLRIALGGALGTGLRLLSGGLLLAAAPSGPLRLLALNVLGALTLGWISVRPPVRARWMPALSTGLLGGFTTFSTMVVQAGTLGHDAGLVAPGSARMTGAGLALVSAYLTASVTLGLAGCLLGRALAARGEGTRAARQQGSTS
jgi:CrcB protein